MGNARSKRNFSKISLLLLAVLFFPISVPVIAFNRIKHQRRRVFLKAFNALHRDGIQASLGILEKNSKSTPPGAEHLFRAIVSKTDSEWEIQTNAWLQHQTSVAARLRPGDGPRFLRLQFDQIPMVQREEKITVIMAAYNAADTIRPAVRSILDQSWRNIELIVVNDKSTDCTGEFLNELAGNDARMVVLHNPKNVGPYVCRNLALTIATGDFVTGHDADDLALPDRLDRQVRPMLDSSDVDAVIGQMVRFNENAELSFASIVHRNSYDGLHRLAMISLMIRRKTLSQFGYWDSVRFGADSELLARLKTAMASRVRTTRLLTMICLDSEGSLTNHAEYGINRSGGTSRIRQDYSNMWRRWHENFAGKVPFREFSNADRPFDAPEKMLVPNEDIDAVRLQIDER